MSLFARSVGFLTFETEDTVLLSSRLNIRYMEGLAREKEGGVWFAFFSLFRARFL